jgi:hypothetical protein
MPKPNFLSFIEAVASVGIKSFLNTYRSNTEYKRDMLRFQKFVQMKKDRDAWLYAHVLLKTLGCEETSSNQILEDLDLGISDWSWMHPTLEEWNKRGMITSKRKDGFLFENIKVPSIWLCRLFNGSGVEDHQSDLEQFFGNVEIWTDAVRNGVLSIAYVEEKVDSWMHSHLDLEFVKRFQDDWKLDTMQSIVLLLLVNQRFKYQSGITTEVLSKMMGGDLRGRWIWKNQLFKKEGRLHQMALIKQIDEGDFFIPAEWHATQKVMDLFYPDLDWPDLESEKPSTFGKLFPSTAIIDEKLFYNAAEASQLKEIGKLLDDKSFQRVSGQLKKKKLGSGITVLLYGAPGTGKTAAVMQWAKLHNRAVYLVDISQIRGKYVGDTERNAKGIFNEYRELAKSMDTMPILLFNEADGLIGKRVQVEKAVDMTLNAMQNIFLQEMEDFEGILVATTNLTQNMDSAFERRFLWKVEIKVPGPDVQEPMMWNAFKGEVSRGVVKELAQRFSLTGGQLTNVRRKFLLGMIATPRRDKSAFLETLIQEELNYNAQGGRDKIGF